MGPMIMKDLQYSDYLMLMAYDEHYGGGSPDPVKYRIC